MSSERVIVSITEVADERGLALVSDQYVRLRDLERPDFLREARQLIPGDADPRYVGLTCEQLAR